MPTDWETVKEMLGGPPFWERPHSPLEREFYEEWFKQFLGYYYSHENSHAMGYPVPTEVVPLPEPLYSPDPMATEWPGFPIADGYPNPTTEPIDIPVTTPVVTPEETVEETVEDDDEEQEDDPSGNDIIENEPEVRRGGAFAFPSPLELVLGTRTHQRWSGKFDPCKALKERSHVRYDKSFRRPGKQKLPRASAIRITYYNRSKCKK